MICVDNAMPKKEQQTAGTKTWPTISNTNGNSNSPKSELIRFVEAVPRALEHFNNKG